MLRNTSSLDMLSQQSLGTSSFQSAETTTWVVSSSLQFVYFVMETFKKKFQSHDQQEEHVSCAASLRVPIIII